MTIRTVLRLLCVLTLVAALETLAGSSYAACEIFPNPGERVFSILRDDVVVGSHRFRFDRHKEKFVVRVDTEAAWTSRSGLDYRLTHHSEEIWVDGWLDSLVSDTKDNHSALRVRFSRSEEGFRGATNGRPRNVSGYLIPSSLWHHDTRQTRYLFSTTRGRLRQVSAYFLGEEEVLTGHGRISAKGYTIYGELLREVWYDADCNLVRAAIPAPDGSTMILELQ